MKFRVGDVVYYYLLFKHNGTYKNGTVIAIDNVICTVKFDEGTADMHECEIVLCDFFEKIKDRIG